MGKRSTIKGYWRQNGMQNPSGNGKGTPGVVPSVVHFQVPADFGLAGGNLSGVWLPKGAIIMQVDIMVLSIAGATTPAIDLGLEQSTPDDNGILSGADISGPVTVNMGDATFGALAGEPLLETSEVTYTDASATQATAGTLDIYIWAIFEDDGVVNS